MSSFIQGRPLPEGTPARLHFVERLVPWPAGLKAKRAAFHDPLDDLEPDFAVPFDDWINTLPFCAMRAEAAKIAKAKGMDVVGAPVAPVSLISRDDGLMCSITLKRRDAAPSPNDPPLQAV